MAQKIYFSDDDIKTILSDLTNRLKRQKYDTGDITLQTSTPDVESKLAVLHFKPLAWMKMMALVHGFDTEVEWHGVVDRSAENEFVVSDVLPFPHEASSATVTSNQAEYEKWQDDLDDDTFKRCRFHGHSHVNMGVSPSGVDMNFRHNKVDNFCRPSGDDDFFYVFIILNKKGDVSGEIYDLMHNVIYKTEDIEIVIDEDEELFNDIREQVEETVDDMLTHLAFDDLSNFNSKGQFSITVPITITTSDTASMEDFLADVKKIVKTPADRYTGGRYYGSGYPYGTWGEPRYTRAAESKPAKKKSKKKKKDERDYDYLLGMHDSYYDEYGENYWGDDEEGDEAI